MKELYIEVAILNHIEKVTHKIIHEQFEKAKKEIIEYRDSKK